MTFEELGLRFSLSAANASTVMAAAMILALGMISGRMLPRRSMRHRSILSFDLRFIARLKPFSFLGDVGFPDCLGYRHSLSFLNLFIGFIFFLAEIRLIFR